MRFPRIPQQLIPISIGFAAVIAAIILARHFLVPPSFGEYGHYRADVLDEIAALDVSYGGVELCGECHDDIVEAKSGAFHRGLACETCHGPAALHAEAPDEHLPIVPEGRKTCLLCHGYSAARPSGFPQVIPERHNVGQTCMECHNPHEPALPRAPEDCSACHRKIWSQKTVSPHAALACADCHDVLPEHMTNPSVVAAAKPTTRSRCGRCHGEDADSPRGIPRIDMATHGERYLCWDCHYPHYPEANP